MNKIKLLLGVAALAVGLSGAVFVKTSVVEAHTRTVKIRVDKNGFSPSMIEAESGHKLNLVFNRANKASCGNEVVFPKLKIRKSLPVGQDVIVSINPSEAGNINFNCGALKGKIVVAD